MRVRRFWAATLVAASVGCNGSDPVAPVTPLYIPPPTVSSISIVGDTELTTGETTQYCVLVRYSDNTEKPCVSVGVEWASSDPALVEVTNVGGVRALRPGTAVISARLQSSSNSASVAIARGWTPWDLLSPQAKEYFRIATLGTFRKVQRWPSRSFPLKVWAASNVNPADVAFATSYWQEKTAGKVSFVPAADSNSADIVVRWKPEGFPNGQCGQIGMRSDNYDVGVIVHVVVHLSAQPNCMVDSNWDRMRIAHEIGHGLGLGQEGVAKTDIMSSVGTCWDMSALTSELINWLYGPSVGPGLEYVDY